ncbi:hypothetical protein [Exiguobacterium sp. s193]|uniref:hypothetical protein n=1 Tax=Exiguobacterium sp. s193 TaxID=2751207 RepID=UPI001BEC4E7D|nr:hypothetical protein [Exiguobacterium sp. s193]
MELMLDTYEYSSKPKGGEIGKLNNRLIKNDVNISVEDLARELEAGKTFAPACFRNVNGQVKRSKEHWYSQQVIGLDFDNGMKLKDAINEFKDSAAFIYTTFSHTNEANKFRVIFILNEPSFNYFEVECLLERLLKKYPMADNACKDCIRLFYGGKQQFKLNYENRITVNDYIEKEVRVFGKTDDSEYIYILPKTCKTLKTKRRMKHFEAKDKSNTSVSNVQLIKQRDSKTLNRILRSTLVNKNVNTKKELLNYLKQQNLRAFLGVLEKGNFLDVLHKESEPSASIFKSDASNGHWLYKCFSKDMPFKGSIIEVTMKLAGVSEKEALLFLSKVYNVEITENDVQMRHRLKIEGFQSLLKSEELKHRYPNFYQIFAPHNRIDNVVTLLDLVKLHLPKYENEKIFFNYSVDTLSKIFSNSRSVAGNKMNMFSLFSLIRKIPRHEVPTELLEKQIRRQKEKKYKYINSTYELNLSDDYECFFEELERRSKIWKKNKMTSKAVNYEGILKNFGIEEANKVFPQDKNKEIPLLNENVTSYIVKVTLEKINELGWVTEKEILENVKLSFQGQKSFKERQLKNSLGEMMEGYDLNSVRLNKKLKESFGIEGKGYGYIICKRSTLDKINETTPISNTNFKILD